MSDAGERVAREVAHGKHMARSAPDLLLGWGSPAGQQRARRRARLILEGARVTATSRVLEVGCGSGLFTEAFAHSGAEIVAVDVSPDLLHFARGRGLPAERVRFLEARFEDCAVEGPFDAVIGSSVLHHLELAESLARMLELLKPGGRMAFAEPNLLNPQVFLERRFRRFFPYVSPDEIAFVKAKLRAELERAGFTDVSIEPFDWLHPAVPRPLIPLVSGIGGVLERLPGVREFAGSLVLSAGRPHSM